MSNIKTNVSLLLLRLSLGGVFVYHGSQKLFGAFGGPGLEGFAGYLTQLGIPFASLNAALAASAEFFGGLALLLGLFVPLMSIPLVFTMLVASFTAHQGFNIQTGGNEYTLILAVATTVTGLMGAGDWSIQNLFSHTASAASEPRQPSTLAHS